MSLSGVSKTAILTLRARAEEHARSDAVFSDPLAVTWLGRTEWPSELDAWYGPDSQMSLALRADDIDQITRRYLEATTVHTVVELGCGLSTRRQRLEDLTWKQWVDVDLPEVVALREQWGAGGERHQQLGCSVLDRSWMDALEGPADQFLFIAEGLFYYLPRADVQALLADMGRRFTGSSIIFDVVGPLDFAKLRDNTALVGAPVQWKLETGFDAVLEDLGLDVKDDFEPEALAKTALDRYWHRFDQKTKGMIFLALNSELFRAGRSGTVLGQLRAAR